MHLGQAREQVLLDFGGLDFRGGWRCRAVEKALEQFRPDAYDAPVRRYALWAELVERLEALAPTRLPKCFAASSGAEAVEIAVRAARAHTGRMPLLSVAGTRYGGRSISPPLDRRAARDAERALARRDVAAFVFEPIALELGVLLPEEDFTTRLQELCARSGTLLVADEVGTGFGRTGRMFAFEHFGLAPDIVCVGRALCAGHAQMGAILTTQRVAGALEAGEIFPSADAWPPLAMRAAIAHLDWLEARKDPFLAHVREVGTYVQTRLAAMDFGCAATIRGRGLAIGLELEERVCTERLAAACRAQRLSLAKTAGGALAILPPLGIDRRTVARGLDLLEAAAARAARS
jgi:4-aminobutyrate aminotransferase-like enzyme